MTKPTPSPQTDARRTNMTVSERRVQRASRVTRADVMHAQAAWRIDAPGGFRTLLDT